MCLPEAVSLVDDRIVKSNAWKQWLKKKQNTWDKHPIPATTIKVGRITPICHGETEGTTIPSLTTIIKVSKVKVQDPKSRTVVKGAWKR